MSSCNNDNNNYNNNHSKHSGSLHIKFVFIGKSVDKSIF